MADVCDGCQSTQKRWKWGSLAEGASEPENFMCVRPAAQGESEDRQLDQPGDYILGNFVKHQFKSDPST